MTETDAPQVLAHDVSAEHADGSGQRPAGPAPGLQGQGQAGFRAGWLMAQLYGPVIDRDGDTAQNHLPSVSELSAPGRLDLAVRELEDALGTAAAGIGYLLHLDAVKAAHRPGVWHDGFREAIGSLHGLLIVEFTVRDPRLGHAYCLGRSLSDTAWLPSDFAGLRRQLNPYRVAELDGWLAGLPGVLGQDAVTAVRGSLRTWSAWTASPFIGRRKLDWARDGKSTELALRHQGAVWHDLLSGESEPASLLTAEAYVGATDMALHRAGFLARQVLAHFWYAFASLLVMVGGLTYLSVAYASGMAKFWGVLATAAGGSSVLIQGVRLALSSLAQRTGAPLGSVERADALQAGAVRLPVGATPGRVRRRVHSREFERPAASAIQPSPHPVPSSEPDGTAASEKASTAVPAVDDAVG